MAGIRLCDPSLARAIRERLRGEFLVIKRYTYLLTGLGVERSHCARQRLYRCWLRGPAVEHWSLADVLSLSCARLVADG